MSRNIRLILSILVLIIFIIFAYRLLFIRTVNYEIGGIKIPSEYNFLTGKVKPILNYKGKAISRTVKDQAGGKAGLSEEQMVVAQLRWAVFEEWANNHPEYKGWQENAQTFKRAHDVFRKEIETGGPRIRVIQ